MAGPGGREIARLAARVLPDTSNFATSLQRYLDRIERRARVQVTAVPDIDGFRQELQARLASVRARVKVDVAPDATGFSGDLQERLTRVRAQVRVPVSPDMRDFTARLRAGLAGAGGSIQVPVSPDASDFPRDLQERLAALRTQVRVPVRPDTAGFATHLRADLAAIRSSIRDAARVPVTADVTRFRASLEAQLRTVLRTPPLTVSVRPTLARNQLSRIRAQITRRPIPVPVTLAPRAGEMRRLRTQLRTTPLRLPTRLDISRGEIRRVQAELLRHQFTIRLNVDDSAARLQRALNGTGAGGGGLGGGLALLPGRFAAIGTAAAGAIPSVTSLIASLAQMAPAAAVGATGLLTLITTAAALKIGTMGVGDALKNAFDPENAEKYAEALKKLTPNAREFVTALKAMGPQFTAVRKAVQERLFEGLGKQITAAGKVALPVLKKGLTDAAGALNSMGSGVLSAAKGLASNGQLGMAVAGANKGLSNLTKIPGQFVTGLTQIAVAASPAFDRITKAAGGAATRVAARISKSLESGAMTKAIDQAISLVGQLFDVLGNIATVLKNVFAPAAAAGGNFLTILQDITGELAKSTGTEGVQSALRALFDTMALIGKTAAPLVGQALQILGPVIEALAPPAQELVRVLGDALSRILTALGPVLSSAAAAVGSLVVALLPLVEVGGQLIAAVLPALVPLFTSLGQIFAELAPVIQALADNLAAQLVPLLASLGPVLEAILPQFVNLASEVLPQITNILVQLTPSLTQLGLAFAELAVALAPIIGQLVMFAAVFLSQVLPAVQPVIDIVLRFATGALMTLAKFITDYAVPALQTIAALLNGDFTGAMRGAATMTTNLQRDSGTAFTNMKATAVRVVGGMVTEIPAAGKRMASGFVAQIQTMILQTGSRIAELPGRIRGALPSPSSILNGAGRQIMQGLISGITSMIPSLSGVLNGITAKIPDWKGPAKRDGRILTPAGRLLISGFIAGIDQSTARLRSRLEAITKALPSSVGRGIGKTLKKATNQLAKLVKQRDDVIAQLAKAEKKLADLVKARDAAAKSVREGILDGANITQQTGEGPTTIASITQQLQNSLAAAKKFGALLALLKKRGLSADLLQQLGEAGVEQGTAAAKALSGASNAQLKQLNKLQSDLSATASKTGNTVADAMYSAGIQSAKGLVAGLKKEKKSIEQVMIDIAKGMQKAIKKALGIHSPAKKMVSVGVNTVRGILLGTDREKPRLDTAMRSLVTAPSVPVVPGTLAAASAGGARFEGDLYLDSGEFLGRVRGEAADVVDGRFGELTQTLRAGRRL